MNINYGEALSRHLETVIPDERAYSRIWLREVAPLASRQAQAVQGGFTGRSAGLGIRCRLSVCAAAHFSRITCGQYGGVRGV